jgi:O-acetyl-ADP-ribose deacetylase (regulator of RNase III)
VAPQDVSRSSLGRIGRYVVQVIQQDITTLPDRVGAVVSSDDNYLSAGGGVSKAIVRAAGDRVLSEMRTHVWGPLGRQTGGLSKLSAGQVIYTTPCWSQRSRQSVFN